MVCDQAALVTETAPSRSPGASPRADTRLRWFELSLVVLLACGGPFLSSLSILVDGSNSTPHFSNLRWSAAIVQEISCLLLVRYILARRNLRFKDLGLRWSLGGVVAGLLIAAVSYVSYSLGYSLVHSLHVWIFGVGTASDARINLFSNPSAMALPFAFLNPFFEELIVRAYLMSELAELTGSRLLAVAVSVLIQSSYHLYYGWQGAIALSFQFLVFAIYYARTRKAAPIIIAHGFFDVYWLLRLL